MATIRKSQVDGLAAYRYRTDGAISNDLGCHILAKKHKARRSLLRIDSKAMHERCESEVLHAMAYQPKLFDGVTTADICAPSVELDAKRHVLIAQLARNNQCASEDF